MVALPEALDPAEPVAPDHPRRRIDPQDVPDDLLASPLPGQDALRPRTRADCRDGLRPCPFVSCESHLYLDVDPETGSITLNFPGLEVADLPQTCARDVADQGEHTLDDVGAYLNVTRERIRQIEVAALVKLRRRGRNGTLGISQEDVDA